MVVPNVRVAAVSTLARWGLAAVWLVSGALKAADLPGTRSAVQAYQLVGFATAKSVALYLPFVEIALGLLLLVGIGTRIVALASALLLHGLIGVIISVWARGLSIDCGCFGGGGYDPNAGPAKYALEIGRDTAFLALAGWLIAKPRSFVALGPGSRVLGLREERNRGDVAFDSVGSER